MSERVDVINKWIDFIEEEIQKLEDKKSGKPCLYFVELHILPFAFDNCSKELAEKGLSTKNMKDEIMEKITVLKSYHKNCKNGFYCMQCPLGGLVHL